MLTLWSISYWISLLLFIYHYAYTSRYSTCVLKDIIVYSYLGISFFTYKL